MAMKIEKILSCICVVMILMSFVPVSVFAVNSGTTNVSGKYNSFQDSNEKVSSMQGGQEVKFIGTAIEYHEGLTMPGDWPWWKVSVDEIISGPSELKGHTVIVSPGVIDPGYMDPNIKLGDTVKVYGKYQEVDNVWIDSSNYYITKEEKKPDLIIQDISWSPSNPNMGDTITFTVKIKNQGSGSAGSSTVKYYISLSYVDSDSVHSLSAGSTSTQTFTWTADKCGDLSVTAKADANSAVTECNEGNNDRTEGTNIFCEETKPVPKITKVDIDPSTCVKEDEYATISVTVANNGGASNEGYISVSFPNDEGVYVVSGTGNKYNMVYQKDDPIWNSAGVQMDAVYPLVELYDSDWDGGQKEIITMNVKPNSGSDEIVFYVRAALKNDADGDYERDPTYSGDKDQQGWYAKKYSVDVCDYEKVKFRGEILVDLPIISYYSFDVKIDEIFEDPTGNLQEGETVNVYGHRSGPAQVDDVTVGDEVEVYGEYRGYGGEYKQIFLSEWGDSSSDHYVKKVDVSDKPDLIDVDIINRFDDKTPQYIHDVFTWAKCVVDKMLRDAFLSFVNAPKEPGVYIDNTINLKFGNYQEIHKVSAIFGTEYVYWDEIFFNNAGNGVYTRNVQIESPIKWRYDTVNTIFKCLSGTGKLPNVPEIGPATLPEVRLQSVLVELNDGSTVSFEINERMEMFSKSNTFPTLVNRDQDTIAALCPIHLLVIDKQGRKVGIEKSSTSYLEFHEIPNAIYSGDTEPEYIILCDIPEYSVIIQAVDEGKFDFKINRSATKTTITYLDVPVTKTTIATVDVNGANPTYTMEVDKYGDGTTIETKNPDSIETDGQDSYSIPLHTGWNLISLPIMPDDTDILDIMNSVAGNWNSVWSYETGNWKRYDLTGPDFLNDLSTIEPGKGYWLNMKSDDTLSISGSELTTKAIPLSAGWNLVGYNSLSSKSTLLAMNSVTGNWNSVWSYEAGNWKRYDLTGPDFLNDLTTMEPGKGYWIDMKSSDTWTLGGGLQ